MKLDHVVIAVADLAQALDDYRALGFNVQPGGSHPHRTSHNALIAFADGAYVELLGFRAPAPGDRWYETFVRHGEGFMDFALLPASVPQAIEQARSRGLALTGPQDGGRARPDGAQLRWQTARQATFDLPFLCADVTPRSGRVPDGEARRHANGATGIARITVAVADRSASLARYRALLGEVEECSGGLRLGSTAIELVETARDRGEGPCAMALRSTSVNRATALDARLTHGAAIVLEP